MTNKEKRRWDGACWVVKKTIGGVAVWVPEDEPFRWVIGRSAYECQVLPRPCQMCGKMTLVGLPAPILKKQPDDTNIVCHPALGGCNQGFHMKIDPACLSRRVLRTGRK